MYSLRGPLVAHSLGGLLTQLGESLVVPMLMARDAIPVTNSEKYVECLQPRQRPCRYVARK